MIAMKALVILPIFVLLGLGASAAFAQLNLAAPVISAVKATNITETSATVTWNTDVASDSLVNFGKAGDALDFGAASPAAGLVHSILLSSLSPGTRYFFEVQSSDTGGNTTTDNHGGGFYRFATREPRVVQQAFVGEVLRKRSKTVTLSQEGAGEQATIALPEHYTLQTPGGPRAGTFQDGARVVILAKLADEDWVASRVLVKPVKPNLPVTGVVVRTEPARVTLMSADGTRHAFSLLATEDNELATGDVITVFRGNPAKARGLIKADEVRDRLQKFLENLVEKADNSASSEGGDDSDRRRANSLIHSLEGHNNHQLQIIDEVLQQAPYSVKPEIQDSKSRVQVEIETAQAAVDRAEAEFQPDEPEDAGDSSKENDGQGQDKDSEEDGEDRDEEDSSEGNGEENPGNGDGPGGDEPGGEENPGNGDGPGDDESGGEENPGNGDGPGNDESGGEENPGNGDGPGNDDEPGNGEWPGNDGGQGDGEGEE